MDQPAPLHWGAEALRLALEPLLPGLTVEVVASIGSTNSELLARARRAYADGADGADGAASSVTSALLVAEQQTAGRGRQGKSWHSPTGASLMFSLALPLAPIDWSGLSLVVGLALAEALDPLQAGQAPRLGLKWPNDLILLDDGGRAPHIGRKLGGILIETVQLGAQRVVVLGMGLNIVPLPPAQGVGDSGPVLSWGYACVQELQPRLDAPGTLARVAVPLVQVIQAFERDGFAPMQAAFARRDVLLGREVGTTLAGLPQGRADGVDASGTLWLLVPEGRRPVASGEVSLRPLARDTETGPC